VPSEELLALWREVQSRLEALLTSLGGRLERNAAATARDYLGHNELGLALEAIADALAEDQTPIRDGERIETLALAKRMTMDDRVSVTLTQCPENS
jgi:hypothetical protein